MQRQEPPNNKRTRITKDLLCLWVNELAINKLLCAIELEFDILFLYCWGYALWIGQEWFLWIWVQALPFYFETKTFLKYTFYGWSVALFVYTIQCYFETYFYYKLSYPWVLPGITGYCIFYSVRYYKQWKASHPRRR